MPAYFDRVPLDGYPNPPLSPTPPPNTYDRPPPPTVSAPPHTLGTTVIDDAAYLRLQKLAIIGYEVQKQRDAAEAAGDTARQPRHIRIKD